MAWTYDPTQIASNTVMQVRYLIGDTLVKDQQVQDEEISWTLTQRGSIYGAASDVCRSLAGRFSREADGSQGNLRNSYSARARAYAARSAQLDVMAIVRSGALPYSGQISVNDYIQNALDPDRIGGQFSIGMDENLLPSGVVGPEVDPLIGGGIT